MKGFFYILATFSLFFISCTSLEEEEWRYDAPPSDEEQGSSNEHGKLDYEDQSSSSSAPSSSSSAPPPPRSSSSIPRSSSSAPPAPRSSSSIPRSSSSVPLPPSSSSSVPPSSSSLAIPFVSCPNPAVSNDSVTCGGQTYKTVNIGSQVWFAKNLNYEVSGSKCYNDNSSNCSIYGRLYDWATAMNLPSSCNSNSCSSQIQSPHRGICPAGWHIPSQADWNVMTAYIGGANTEGKKLKATSGWFNSNVTGNGTDEYGFAALPGGSYSDGRFSGGDNGSESGNWWSASEDADYYAYNRIMSNLDLAYWGASGKSTLRSVRCLKD